MKRNLILIAILITIGFGLGIGCSQIHKRSKLRKYYFNELRLWSGGTLTLDAQSIKLSEARLEETKSHMLQDGYNRAEIQEIGCKAYSKAVKEKEQVEALMEKNGVTSFKYNPIPNPAQ